MKEVRQKGRSTRGEIFEGQLSKVGLCSDMKGGKVKFLASSSCGVVMLSVENCVASIVEEGFEMLRVLPAATGPDNITIIKDRKNVRFEEKNKQRSWEKPREMSIRRAMLRETLEEQ